MEGIYIVFILLFAILVPIMLYDFLKTHVILPLKYKLIEFRRIIVVRRKINKINYPEILKDLNEIDSEYKKLMSEFQNLKEEIRKAQ
jgi:hypothetical protein